MDTEVCTACLASCSHIKQHTASRASPYTHPLMECLLSIDQSLALTCRDLYARFYEAFADMGEPNIPIDKTMMRSDAFKELLDRLRQHAEEHYRDHW